MTYTGLYGGKCILTKKNVIVFFFSFLMVTGMYFLYCYYDLHIHVNTTKYYYFFNCGDDYKHIITCEIITTNFFSFSGDLNTLLHSINL